MSGKVSTRTAKAGAWLLVAIFFVKGVDFLLLLVLARLLLPADFAVIALAMIFVQITEAVLELPISQAMIRVSKLTRPMLDTAFTLSLMRALVISGLLALLAPVAAATFDDSRLTILVMVLALGPAFRGLVSPRMVEFARDLDYRRDALLPAIGKAFAFCVALLVAFLTKSYWALAVGAVVTPFIMTVVSYFYAPYWPRLSVREWPTFADMVGWNTVSQIFGATNWQIDIFVLGRSVASDILGRFSIAGQLAMTPNQLIALPIVRPFMAAFSTLGAPEAIRGGYRKASTAVFTLSAPILVTVGLLAQPVIVILFDDNWTEAAGYLEPLAYVALIAISVEPTNAVAMTLNRTRLVAARSFIELVIKTPLLFIGLSLFGIYGVIGARAVGRAASLACGMLIAKSLLNYRLVDQAAALSRPLIGLMALIIVVVALRPLIDYDKLTPLIVTTGGVAGLGLFVYTAIVFALWRSAGRPNGLERMTYDLAADIVQRALRLLKSKSV